MSTNRAKETQGRNGSWALRPEEWVVADCVARLTGNMAPELRPSRPVTGQDWRAALVLATWHNLLPVLHFCYEGDSSLPAMPDSVATRLRHSYKQAAAAHLLQQTCLRALLDSLMAEGVPAIVLKGMPLAESLYPEPALRQAGDIDLMLSPSAFPRG